VRIAASKEMAMMEAFVVALVACASLLLLAGELYIGGQRARRRQRKGR
jgi:hypothetical protein